MWTLSGTICLLVVTLNHPRRGRALNIDGLIESDYPNTHFVNGLGQNNKIGINWLENREEDDKVDMGYIHEAYNIPT